MTQLERNDLEMYEMVARVCASKWDFEELKLLVTTSVTKGVIGLIEDRRGVQATMELEPWVAEDNGIKDYN